jgi:predicted permease
MYQSRVSSITLRIAESLAQDIRIGLRSLRRQPGFLLAAVGTATLGIGLNTAVFTVFNAIALRPWPAVDPDRVAMVWQRTNDHGAVAGLTLEDFEGVRTQTKAFAHLAGIRFSNTRIGARPVDDFEYVSAGMVSSAFFNVMGVPMARGRGFGLDDERPGAPGVVVISHRTWQLRFAGHAEVIGQPLYIAGDSVPFTIVGVAAEHFHAPPPQRHDVWFPLAALNRVRPDDTALREGRAGLTVVGRLAPGVSRRAAAAELSRIHAQHRRASGRTSFGLDVTTTSLIDRGTGGAWSRVAGLALVQAAGAIVLFLACVNVANMQLARGTARRDEIAVRLSLGAGRARIARQLFVESALIAVAAAASAIAIAYLLPAYIYRRFAEPEGIWQPWTPDASVLVAAVGLGLLSAIIFGLVPSLRTTRSIVPGRHGRALRPGFRSLILGTQIALSTVLLVAAALLSRSLSHVTGGDPGFDLQAVSVARITAPTETDGQTSRRNLTASLRAALQSSALWPVGFADYEPLEPTQLVARVRHPGDGVEAAQSVQLRPLSAESFEILGLRLTAGRIYGNASDSYDIVVNETMARRFWPSGDAVGQSLLYQDVRHAVVGVVGDARLASFESVQPMLHHAPRAGRTPRLLFRLPPAAVESHLPSILRGIDPRLAVQVVPLSANVQRALEAETLATRIAWVIGLVGLALATVGVHGVFALTVEARRRDLGIRLALGATRWQVFVALLQVSRWALAGGLMTGLLLAIGVSALLQSRLFGLSPLDPVAYALTLAILLLAAVIAMAGPIRRAARIDPVASLRSD